MKSSAVKVSPQLESELSRVMARRSFDVLFQPIVDSVSARIVGYEALTRAPADSPLHAPAVLFDVAAAVGRLVELERLVLRRIVTRFAELGLPGLLFVNVTADTLLAAKGRQLQIAGEFSELGMETSRVVVELTETRPVLDLAQLDSAVLGLRATGFKFALDDLGEGFASLKRWVDLRPDFVKIDRHFVDGVASDPVKQRFIRSILDMARSSHADVVAEGLEQEGDLACLRTMGVALCQGYLFARPSPTPRSQLRADLLSLLSGTASSQSRRPGQAETAGDLARPAQTVSASSTCAEVIQRFRDDDYLHALPVVDHDRRPLGLLRSMHVLKRGAERYFTDLFGRRSCTELMDHRPWTFDVGTSLRSISETISNSDDRFLADGYLVTEQGRFIGVGRASDLIKALADQQAYTARHEHPLTGLPGVQTLDPQLQMWARRQARFAAVLFGISAFKGFNAEYGHEQGDQLIRFVGALISKAAAPVNGFVSHFNSDDFLLLMPADGEWQRTLRQICTDFDAGVHRFLRTEHVLAGGYPGFDRHQSEVMQALPSLRAGGRLCDQHKLAWSELLSELRALRQAAKHQGRESRFVLAGLTM